MPVIAILADIPVPAILAGRGFLGTGFERLITLPDDVAVDRALPGLEIILPPGVTSPDLDPNSYTIYNNSY